MDNITHSAYYTRGIRVRCRLKSNSIGFERICRAEQFADTGVSKAVLRFCLCICTANNGCVYPSRR